jgi:hypothetical protein
MLVFYFIVIFFRFILIFYFYFLFHLFLFLFIIFFFNSEHSVKDSYSQFKHLNIFLFQLLFPVLLDFLALPFLLKIDLKS